MRTDTLEAVADRGYFNSPEILECHEAGITVTLPKPMTSGAKAAGRFGKQDFVYLPDEDVYRCPAGERLKCRYSNEEDGKELRRYWTTACPKCPIKSHCTTGPERRITRWQYEEVLEAVQQHLDANPQAMRQRRETVEHPFGTMKGAHGGDALPHQDSAEGCSRDGALSSGLQSDARHEYRRHQAAGHRDQSLRPPHIPAATIRSRTPANALLHGQDPKRSRRIVSNEAGPCTRAGIAQSIWEGS